MAILYRSGPDGLRHISGVRAPRSAPLSTQRQPTLGQAGAGKIDWPERAAFMQSDLKMVVCRAVNGGTRLAELASPSIGCCIASTSALA
jgi:hypothetical protein